MAESGLAAWVEGLRARYGTMRSIAELIGMSESGFTRGVKRGTLSVDNLLDLARVTDEHPSKVLRVAGKDHVATLIEMLYGTGHDALTSSQREIVEIWDRIPDARRRPLLEVMQIYAAAPSPAPQTEGPGRSPSRSGRRGGTAIRRRRARQERGE